jgi:hypothetical protein
MFSLGALTLACLLGLESAGQAQVFVRAPFVRVFVGPGVYVRAPFVNLAIPGPPPVYVVPPPSQYVPPPGTAVPPANQAHQGTQVPQQTAPPPEADLPAPAPKALNHPTLEDFAKNFQAREGSYNVTIINPVTKAPTAVRFSLPEGQPRRVVVRQNEIEFHYGLRRFVRIQFDADGAVITSR